MHAMGQCLRVGHVNMVRLHEGFLYDLPVGADDLGNMRLLVAALVGKELELAGQIAEEVL